MNFEETAVLPGGSGRFPEEGNGYPLHYSCLENSMDRGAWRATVHGGHKESDMTERLNNNNNKFYYLFKMYITPL